ncbi:hypothetical protein [Rhodopseudomonas sp. BR0C11]|uniref:hypothetical protein n=1 Tax=Rhodopseudomonas sp. BR0C11 TaxID=2269370 RepID=UPI0013DEE791|nr:hypothetical protein [Rhodopseudomonas sp. BR0C11]
MLEQMRMARAERERPLQRKVDKLRVQLSDEHYLNLRLLDDLATMSLLVTTDLGKHIIQFTRDSIAAEYEPVLRQVLAARGPVQVAIDPQHVRTARDPMTALLELAARQFDQRAKASIGRIDTGSGVVRTLQISVPAVTVNESVVDLVPAG